MNVLWRNYNDHTAASLEWWQLDSIFRKSPPQKKDLFQLFSGWWVTIIQPDVSRCYDRYESCNCITLQHQWMKVNGMSMCTNIWTPKFKAWNPRIFLGYCLRLNLWKLNWLLFVWCITMIYIYSYVNIYVCVTIYIYGWIYWVYTFMYIYIFICVYTIWIYFYTLYIYTHSMYTHYFIYICSLYLYIYTLYIYIYLHILFWLLCLLFWEYIYICAYIFEFYLYMQNFCWIILISRSSQWAKTHIWTWCDEIRKPFVLRVS